METIRGKALPALPADLATLAAETVEAFERLGPDPHGSTYGFFDGHGWNMAFDHGEHRLSELAELVDDPEHAPTMLRSVETWAATVARAT
ncbi:hypothetical protein IB264_06320 [Ensifer sp. ENS11]|nr:hypothetical protein ASD03_02040 [Ensifer sp. Root127]MBD9486847.1 hypothetical protein [Ensifer sp. ENS11]